MNVRVLLVDDHKMMRDGLRSLLAGVHGIEVVGEASDGRTAFELVRTLHPDVVVMDVGMPDQNGIEATRRIRGELGSVAIIALSTHTDQRYVQSMLDAGASGYVLKIEAYAELLRAVRAVCVGRIHLSAGVARSFAERAASASVGQGNGLDARLGAREREVLQLVAEGKSSAEAAEAMCISIKTIETHRRNITQKLGLHGTAELTKYAVREGLTSLDR